MAILNLTFQEYLELPGLNASKLKPYSISAKHGKHKELKGFAQSSAMNMGSLIHAYVLEGEEAAKDLLRQDYILDGFPVHENGKYKGQVYGDTSDVFQNWLAEQSNKRYLFPKQVDSCLKIARSVNRNPIASGILESCPRRETVLTWDCKGTPCKAMIDLFGTGCAGDLKSMSDLPTKRNIEKAIHKYQYDIQFAFYYDGLEANEIDIEKFYGIFAQSKDEMECTVMAINDETIEYGRIQYEYAIGNYLSVKESNDFMECPGLYSDVITGGLPEYITRQDEDDFVNTILEMAE